MTTPTTPTTPTSAGKAATARPGAYATAPRGTACYCPDCGEPATYDLAVVPGLRPGGPPAPPLAPPPEVVTPPPAPPDTAGDWLLVVCSTGAHRTLWPEFRVDELANPPAPAPGPTAAPAHAAARK